MQRVSFEITRVVWHLNTLKNNWRARATQLRDVQFRSADSTQELHSIPEIGRRNKKSW